MATEPERISKILAQPSNLAEPRSAPESTQTPPATSLDNWNFAQTKRRGFMQRHVENQLCVSSSPEESVVFAKLSAHLGTGFIFVLTGMRGSGKTQIATSIACGEFHRMVYDWRNFTEAMWPLYTTARALFAEIRSTYDPNSEMNETQVLRKFSEPHLLVIDEAQERGNTDWEDRTLTDIIDRRYGMQRDTIIICNLTRQEIAAALGTSIISRLHECGEVIECNWPSFREVR